MSESSTPSAPPAVLNRKDLPLKDYDHLNFGALAGRIRSLDAEELAQLLAFEEAHASRTAVVQVMKRRLQELKNGATPSAGGKVVADPEPENADAEPA